MRKFRGILSAAALMAVSGTAMAATAPAWEPRAEIGEALRLMMQQKTAEADAALDKAIAAQEREEAKEKRRIYCIRSSAETVMYMAMAANEKTEAVALPRDCSLSYYLKAFVLIDLQRGAEAKPYLDRAIARSPYDAQYLAELAEWHKMRREWPEALALFQRADAATDFSPADAKAGEQSRAWRGIGFVLIEQGKLDEAEQMFKKCLEANPNDAGAKGELDYIKTQRGKT